MFPVSRNQAKSMAKMQVLKPEMDRIKERYKGDQQKQAAAMQDLYRKHGVNPLAGCLPALIQLPIFIGLYRGLAVDVELRQAPLFGEGIQWCSNLAAPDMLYNWSWFMPGFVNRAEGFFGLGPYLNVLPLITVGLFLLQQKMFMPEPANEQAALQQKIMKYMMVFMGLMFYKVPSGLCLYFIASSLWGIAEKKMIPPPTAPTEGTTSLDSPPTRSKSSGGTYPEKRSQKNGEPKGRGPYGSKKKR
jgi:YidC/Oxa1 family membrane protein insertase